MPLTLNSRHLGNVYILQCHGRIAMGDEAKAMETALEFATREFSRLVLNMSKIDRLDSTGIGLLVVTPPTCANAAATCGLPIPRLPLPRYWTWRTSPRT